MPDKKADATLADRIHRAQQNARRHSFGDDSGSGGSSSGGSGMALGLKLSSEFVAGILLGAGIGWFLDRWLETGPLFLIVFLGLGAAAGFVNVIRASAPRTGGGKTEQTGADTGPEKPER